MISAIDFLHYETGRSWRARRGRWRMMRERRTRRKKGEKWIGRSREIRRRRRRF